MLTRKRIALSLLPILGMVYLCFGLMRCLQTKEFLNKATPAMGEIISSVKANAGSRRVGNIYLYFPVVSFKTKTNREIFFKSELPILHAPKIKMHLPVLYVQNKDFVQAVLDDPFIIWSGHLFKIFFGLTMLILARYISPNKSLQYLQYI